MIKAKVSTDYKDIDRIFAGGSIQKEILKVWSTEADAYVFEAWKILEMEEPLPLTINANGEPLIDYRIYGNTIQNGTPTPENPIMPIGCGELETTGTRTGQYKLPILSNSTVTNIYLGEVQTTRRIKKLVLTGEEDWELYKSRENIWQFYVPDMMLQGAPVSSAQSNIAPYGATTTDRHLYDYGCYTITKGAGIAFQMKGAKDIFTNMNDWTSYLAAQYASGTPVTIWYVLAEPETGIVNEPLMKIDKYADTVSMEQAGVSIPTNKGTTILDYDRENRLITSDGHELVDKNQNGFLLSGSTLRPSKMYIKYKGR